MAVKKIRLRERTGEECPGGTTVFQARQLASIFTGGRDAWATPELLGPLNWFQFVESAFAKTRDVPSANRMITGNRRDLINAAAKAPFQNEYRCNYLMESFVFPSFGKYVAFASRNPQS
jgi:hypothetical protein